MWALIWGYSNCVKLLRQAGAFMRKNKILDPLIIRVVNDRRFEYLEVLGPAGADVNTKDKRREPLVVTMVKDTRYDYLEFLVRAGADVNAMDNDNNTALITVANNLRATDFASKCVKLLLSAGAEVNIMNSRSLNALSECIMSHVGRPLNRKLCMMLFAAGETVVEAPIPEFLVHNDLNLC